MKDDASWQQLGSPLELTAVYVKCEKRLNDHVFGRNVGPGHFGEYTCETMVKTMVKMMENEG